MAKSSDRRNGQRLRQKVVVEAARIMATEGQRSFLLAKQKAARRLGLSDRQALPSNAEIDLALREWHEVYGGEDHAEIQTTLRSIAADTMRWLAPFSPRLVGPVLTGTADQFSAICLHAFVDDPDALVHFFMEHGIDFQQKRRRIRWHDDRHRDIDVLVIERRGAVIELMLMVGADARQAPPCPVDGRPQIRASVAEVNALVAESIGTQK